MNKMIIFDMDGVLVDACDWHRIALNKALKEICNYEISLEDHYSVFNGLPTKVKLSKLAESGLIENSKIKEIYEKKQEITINTINKEATLRNEKINMIETLKDEGFYVT
jgi:beta-phosphoglucomutase-like phosphatase (HAD superfamily)